MIGTGVYSTAVYLTGCLAASVCDHFLSHPAVGVYLCLPAVAVYEYEYSYEYLTQPNSLLVGWMGPDSELLRPGMNDTVDHDIAALSEEVKRTPERT